MDESSYQEKISFPIQSEWTTPFAILKYHDDKRYFVVGGQDGTIHVWSEAGQSCGMLQVPISADFPFIYGT